MDFIPLFDVLGEPITVTVGALVIGIVFGVAAQQSRFCVRSAVMDVTGRYAGTLRWQRLAVWLGVFGAAIAATQFLIHRGSFDPEGVRQLTNARSISGVLIGGLLFGIGMSLTRGCVSRLTVLSATGNLRAVFSLAVFAPVAYATFDGALTPLRQTLLGLWIVGPDTNLNLLSELGGTPLGGIALGGVIAAVALAAGRVFGLPFVTLLWGGLAGLTIAAGWWLTSTLSTQVFEPITVESIGFIRPSIDTISLGASGFAMSELGFGTGMLAGVVIGSFCAAALSGGLQLQWFSSPANVVRYAAGAALMGFGGVMAGGCTVGAGLTGGSLFALAPLIALASMVVGSAITELVLQRVKSGPAAGELKPVAAE